MLGSRLAAGGPEYRTASTLAYIVAADMEHVLDLWIKDNASPQQLQVWVFRKTVLVYPDFFNILTSPCGRYLAAIGMTKRLAFSFFKMMDLHLIVEDSIFWVTNWNNGRL